MKDLQTEFIAALQANQDFFNVSLSEKNLSDLAVYYAVVRKHNEILHLVAPCSPEEFAVRHVLESLTLLDFLPPNAAFADVGAGAGLPSIPCLIARGDARGVLIESKEKKTNFLREAAAECSLENRVEILNRQFEELPTPLVSHVCCRALDKFTRKLPRLLKWSGAAAVLLFGGGNLRGELEKRDVKFGEKLLPLSEQRYLFSVRK